MSLTTETPAQDPQSPAPQAAETEENLTGHAYDGIQEYDNPLPGWWTWLFIASIVFAAVYFAVSLIAGPQMSPHGVYDRDKAEDLKRQMAGGVLAADAKTLILLSKDPETLGKGTAIFATNCIACHKTDGSGLIGPNLTDDYYLNVEKISDIPDVVSKGRKNGAMPAWGNRLSSNEVIQVSAFVASLRGKNLPSIRPAEGKIIPPWSE
jgi:cytochrome c oxidase cbb3-type subunit 3